MTETFLFDVFGTCVDWRAGVGRGRPATRSRACTSPLTRDPLSGAAVRAVAGGTRIGSARRKQRQEFGSRPAQQRSRLQAQGKGPPRGRITRRR